MKNNLKSNTPSWKDTYKTSYEASSNEVPEQLWEKLEGRLNQAQEIEPTTPKYNGVWRYAAAAVLLIGFASVLFWMNNTEDASLQTQIVKQEPVEVSSPTINLDTTKVFENAIKPNNVHEEDLNVKEITTQKIAEFNSKPSVESSKVKASLPKIMPKQPQGTPEVDLKPSLSNQKGETQVPEQYVSAGDLLFGRELEKEKKQGSKEKLGQTQPSKPSKVEKTEVKILGVTVYQKEEY